MTAAIATECPSWCTRDHEAIESRERELFELDVASGTLPDTPEMRAGLEVDVRSERGCHDLVVLRSGRLIVAIESVGDEIQIDAYIEDSDGGLNVAEARELAAGLLAAADKLDQITGGAA